MEVFKTLAGRKSEGVSKFLIDLRVIKKKLPDIEKNKFDFGLYLKLVKYNAI